MYIFNMTPRFPISICAAVLVMLSLSSCTDNAHHKRLFFRMDTVTEITLSVPQRFDVKPVWRSIDSLLSQYEKRFSATGDKSEINAINKRNSNAVPVSPELGEMIKLGTDYGDTLNGAFDITVLPLKELWGLCEQCGGDEPLPDLGRVNTAVQNVDYRLVRVNDAGDSAFFESSDTRIDVGGIAKGYVLTLLEALIKSRGVDNFLIAAGGDIVASGQKNNSIPWCVGVQHPRNQSELITTVSMESGALVTSGDYNRFRMVDGNRYHHIFDPSTGYTCGRNQSLTIRADDPVRADILSTGLFCRDAADIVAFADAREGLECLVVDSVGQVHVSAGWR